MTLLVISNDGSCRSYRVPSRRERALMAGLKVAAMLSALLLFSFAASHAVTATVNADALLVAPEFQAMGAR